MVITVLVLGNLWRIWRKRESERSQLAAMSSRELEDIGLTDAERQMEVDAPLWRVAVTQYRQRAAGVRARRARTQRAIYRLSRMESARDDDYPQSTVAS